MDTKAELLDSAEQMIRQRGYDAVSFGDLADDIQIRKASIHYHFPKKADLALDLVTRYAARLNEARDEISQNSETGGAALAGLVTLYRDALDEGRQICLCVMLASGRDALDERVLAQLHQFHADSLSWIETTIARGGADGSILLVSDPVREAMATLALLEGAHILARAAEDVTPFDAATQTLLARIR